MEDGVNYIPEIVINALTLEDAKNSLIEGINALNGVEGVLKVSAGNYGGNLGKYKFYLKEMLE